MKKSEKAMLFSIVVYPGTGHFVLKKYVMGSALVVTATGALYALLSLIVTKVMQIRDLIRTNDIEPSVDAIWTLLAEHQTIEETQTAGIALGIFIAVWLIGIADVNRCGRTYQPE